MIFFFFLKLNVGSNFNVVFLQTELLIQAHLTRQTTTLTPELQNDYKRVVELAPRLIDELMKVLLVIFSPWNQSIVIGQVFNCL